MSRVLLLKRHIDSESELLDYGKSKPSYYPSLHQRSPAVVSNVVAGTEPLHHIYGERLYSLDHHASVYTESSLAVALSAPLDLSLKSSTPITPPSTPSPCLPSRKNSKADENTSTSSAQVTPPKALQQQPPHQRKMAKPKKQKANRKLNFDEDKSSPVSGTIIRDRSELSGAHVVVQKGDIDPMYNVVEVTEEAKAELAKIENKIGDYLCKLCNEMYKDAFSLAQHRCSCIIHVEYKCPECEKVFNCPANLASHRRWHKPKASQQGHATPVEFQTTKTGYQHEQQTEKEDSESDSELQIPCPICRKLFRKQTYLRKHLSTHHVSEIQQHISRPSFAFHHITAAN